jgi:hypothetical protein
MALAGWIRADRRFLPSPKPPCVWAIREASFASRPDTVKLSDTSFRGLWLETEFE